MVKALGGLKQAREGRGMAEEAGTGGPAGDPATGADPGPMTAAGGPQAERRPMTGGVRSPSVSRSKFRSLNGVRFSFLDVSQHQECDK